MGELIACSPVRGERSRCGRYALKRTVYIFASERDGPVTPEFRKLLAPIELRSRDPAVRTQMLRAPAA
jgi:hypothetical protein